MPLALRLLGGVGVYPAYVSGRGRFPLRAPVMEAPRLRDPDDHRLRMDTIYRHQRHFYDVTRRFCLFGRDRLIRGLVPPAGGSVLEIGCGTGRNLIVAARRYRDVRFYGFDLSGEMLKTARANIARAGLSGRIEVVEGDATAFDAQAAFGCPAFDRVFVSYALSMIPQWSLVLPAALGLAAAGGSLHIVDFGQQGGWPAGFKRALFAWLAHFTVVPRADLEVRLIELARSQAATLDYQRLYRGYADYAVVRRVG